MHFEPLITSVSGNPYYILSRGDNGNSVALVPRDFQINKEVLKFLPAAEP